MSATTDIKKLYTLSCNSYDLHMRKSGHYRAQKRILELIKAYIKEPILDVACGPGFFAQMLSKKFSQLYINDFSPGMIKIASTRLSCPATIENAETLTSYKKKVNTIICCNLFYYLKNKEKALKRWQQILNPNGVIIVIEEYPFRKPAGKQIDEFSRQLMSLISPVSISITKKIFRNSDFELINQVETPIDQKHNLYAFVFTSR